MKKKWLTMGAVAGISAVVLTVSAMSAAAGTSGYDAWKEALKETKTSESISGQVRLTITDNGTELLGGNAAFKKNGQDASASVALKAGEVEHGLDAYVQDGKAVVKWSDRDVYEVIEHKDGAHSYGPPWKRGRGEQAPDPEMADGVERVIDALVGNLKNRVTLEEQAGGSRQVSLHLTGNQVPAAVNVIGSLMLRRASSGETSGHPRGRSYWAAKWHGTAEEGDRADGHPLFGEDLKVNLPKLTDEIRVEAIRLDATIAPDNSIDDKSVEIRISGKDEAGQAHDIVFYAAVDLYDRNATTPDAIDLTGKPVETRTIDESSAGWRHGRGGR